MALLHDNVRKMPSRPFAFFLFCIFPSFAVGDAKLYARVGYTSENTVSM